jgi:SAM-dependent methyltransferase
VNLRTSLFLEFVMAHIPAPPARILEVGCGSGQLALALADRGFDVTAIDPRAPEGPIFRQMRLEDFSETGGYDAVLAVASLHHIHDLDGALDKVASLLGPTGIVIVEEFARERLVGATARWYYAQRRALAQAGRVDSDVPEDFDTWARASVDDLADLHPASAIVAALQARFAERILEQRPYLYSWRLDDTIEPLERALIAEGGIEATGWWFVGERS